MGGQVTLSWVVVAIPRVWSTLDFLLNVIVIYYCVQSGSGANPASYPMGTRGSFAGG
jgi:hypothetical protein